MENKNQPLVHHHWLALFVVLLILAVILVNRSHNEIAQAVGTATLSLTPSSNSVALNQNFNVTVNLNTGGSPIDGIDIYKLHFNPAILQVVDADAVTTGVQIAAGSVLPVTNINTVDNVAGTIQFAQSTSGGTSFTGSGTIGTITFRGIANGSSSVTFDFTSGSTTDTNVAFQGVDQLSSVTNGTYTIDGQAPTAPSALTATAISTSQINLSWTASTDNVAVSNYLIEQCSGAACATFTQIGTSASNSFSNTGLSASTSYSYRVRATDAVGNLSSYSATATASTQAGFDFALSNGGAKTVTQGSNITNTITATLSSGTTQAVTFTASGLPTGVSTSFAPASCSPTCTTTVTLTASATATIGAATITVTGTAGAVVHTTTFTLTVNSSTFARTINIASLQGLATKIVSGTLNVYNTSKVLLKTYAFTTDASGNSNITFDIAAQSTFLQTKATPFLTREISQDLNTNATYNFAQLLTGDINQDNIINSVDYSVLNTNWFTAAASADLNKDGLVNSIDYSFMNANWLISGEQ